MSNLIAIIIIISDYCNNIGPGGQGVVPNNVIWQAVDIIKQHGFTIDFVIHVEKSLMI
jgi:hypothetical protein